MYFDFIPGQNVDKEEVKSVRICTTGADKQSFVLAVSASGDVLSPMIIFHSMRKLIKYSFTKSMDHTCVGEGLGQ